MNEVVDSGTGLVFQVIMKFFRILCNSIKYNFHTEQVYFYQK